MAQQTVFLEPGEQVVIPAGAVIDSIIADGDIVVTSSCGDVTSVTDTYACLQFDFGQSDAADPAALESLDLESVEVGGTVYAINAPFPFSAAGIASTINAETGPVFVVYSAAVDSTSYNDRTEYSIGVKVPSLLVDSVKFKLTGTAYTYGVYVISTTIGDCACVTVTSGGSASDTYCV